MNINNLFGVKGKVILITGGSRGIGEMIASGFLANGAKVYISSRKIKDCDATAQRLTEKYESECISIPADISDLNGINELFTNFDKYNDNLDVLINNAGAVWGEPLHKFSEDGWDKVMDLNVKSIFFMIQKFLDLLKKNTTSDNPARIINIGSIDGINTPYYENYSYSVAKSAVHKLTSVLAAKLIKDNIICNAIAPGFIQTDMTNKGDGKLLENWIESIPLKRAGNVSDVANLCSYLASDKASYITGQIIKVDGGLVT